MVGDHQIPIEDLPDGATLLAEQRVTSGERHFLALVWRTADGCVGTVVLEADSADAEPKVLARLEGVTTLAELDRLLYEEIVRSGDGSPNVPLLRTVVGALDRASGRPQD